MLGYFKRSSCGLGSMLLSIAATMTACRIGATPPPSPGAFPIEGIHQLTQDYTFYQSLIWSPDGSRLAFTYAGDAGANAVYVAEVPMDLRP